MWQSKDLRVPINTFSERLGHGDIDAGAAVLFIAMVNMGMSAFSGKADMTIAPPRRALG
jgi:hypothetical protein